VGTIGSSADTITTSRDRSINLSQLPAVRREWIQMTLSVKAKELAAYIAPQLRAAR
jgi:hypothetical protein